jgi:hypothetical protein
LDSLRFSCALPIPPPPTATTSPNLPFPTSLLVLPRVRPSGSSHDDATRVTFHACPMYPTATANLSSRNTTKPTQSYELYTSRNIANLQAGLVYYISVPMPVSTQITPSRCIHADETEVYPFFRFTPTPDDPYTFPLTFTASCVIWVRPNASHLHFSHNEPRHPVQEQDLYTTHRPTMPIALTLQGSELLSSFVARQVMIYAFKVDVTAIGLDEMREYPELGTSRSHGTICQADKNSSGLRYDTVLTGIYLFPIRTN